MALALQCIFHSVTQRKCLSVGRRSYNGIISAVQKMVERLALLTHNERLYLQKMVARLASRSHNKQYNASAPRAMVARSA